MPIGSYSGRRLLLRSRTQVPGLSRSSTPDLTIQSASSHDLDTNRLFASLHRLHAMQRPPIPQLFRAKMCHPEMKNQTWYSIIVGSPYMGRCGFSDCQGRPPITPT